MTRVGNDDDSADQAGVSEKSNDTTGKYKWGGRFSPENIISRLDPDTYPLPPVGEDPREYASRVPVEIETEYPIEPDRILGAIIFAMLLSFGFSLWSQATGWAAPNQLEGVVTIGMWTIAVLYLLTGVSWLRNAIAGWITDPPPMVHGPEEVQVRILTINAQGTVQRTVDHLPESLTDRYIIAEEPMDISGAEVHVVPDEFECVATNKGRALEWARRNVTCEREYVLYLDEDTIVPDFNGLPDADIVQFREWPMKTDSWWTYWAEVIRMGFQIGQVGYADRDIPLYAWGGGLAIRTSVEDSITWDFNTLVEDTVFTWFAVQNGANYEVVDTRFRNQAPLSISDMFDQRQRWLVGTLREEEYLSLRDQLLLTIRNVVWAFSPILAILSVTIGIGWVVGMSAGFGWSVPFQVGSLALLVVTIMWVLAGIGYYKFRLQTLPVLGLFGILIVLHSVGALKGFIFPPHTFKATEKSNNELTKK